MRAFREWRVRRKLVRLSSSQATALSLHMRIRHPTPTAPTQYPHFARACSRLLARAGMPCVQHALRAAQMSRRAPQAAMMETNQSGTMKMLLVVTAAFGVHNRTAPSISALFPPHAPYHFVHN